MKNTAFKIAIIGLGPKGMYGFERLLAELKASPCLTKVDIFLFNRTRFMGSGDVYRSDQPKYLLMNFPNKHIQMWTEDFPPSVKDECLSFLEFLSEKQYENRADLGNSYAPRCCVGQYLEYGFAKLIENLPENVKVYQLISEVYSVEKNEKRYSIHFSQRGKMFRLDNFQSILISTGHQCYKWNSNPAKIPFIYPVEEKLKPIKKNQTVAIKGMGLTFIDAVLALTEGKGGSFNETTSGQLIYIASGTEPKCIYPFSKSGWPMFPKYDFENEQHLYVESLVRLKQKQLSFEKDILPPLIQDMEFAYYKILFSSENEELKFACNHQDIKDQIEAFHQKYSGHKAFSIKNLFEPDFNSEKSMHQNIINMLSDITNEKKIKITDKAKLGAAAIWRKISPIFNKIYSFNGLDADSHETFDQYYFGKLNRIAYGPPPSNLQKVLAIANAGIIDFRFAKNPEIIKHGKAYRLQNEASMADCDLLIDARIPKNDTNQELSGLYRNLCKNHLARPYVNKSTTSHYELGTIEINRKGQLINAQGNPECINLYGTPTEGVVHDNDTLSRTRNNFGSPWARETIQQLINYSNEISQQPTETYSNPR